MTDEQQDEQFYRDTEGVAFPKLNDHQLSLLEPLGERRLVERGDLVYKAGQRDLGLTILLRGEIEAFEQRDDSEQILATAHERDFIGDVAMLQGTSALASARVTSPDAEILHIPALEMRRALAEIPGVSKTIVDALIMRRRRIRRDREFAGMRILASSDARDGHQLDDFLDKNRIPHRLVEVESEQGQALTDRFHLTSRDLPVLITPGGRRLRQPSLREVAREAGLLRSLAEENESEIFCDLTIVGAGPAGLAAAVYAASEGLKTVVLESYAPGGQAGSSSLIENFFGFPTGIGNSAGQAAMFLSEGAAKVLLVVRGNNIKMSDYLSRRVQARDNIEILYNTEIRKMSGGKKLEQIELENTKSGERRIVQTPAVSFSCRRSSDL